MSSRRKKKRSKPSGPRIVEDSSLPIDTALVGDFSNGSYHAFIDNDGGITPIQRNQVATRMEKAMVLHTDEGNMPNSFVGLVSDDVAADAHSLMDEINANLSKNMRAMDNGILDDLIRSAESGPNNSRGLFQQQSGTWKAASEAASEINKNVMRGRPGIPQTTIVPNTMPIASTMTNPLQVIQDALDSHRREIDRMGKHMGQLQAENESLKAELARQGKVLDKLLNMFRNPTKRKRGTV